MFLDSLADSELIFPDLPAFDVESLLRTFARRIVERRGTALAGLAEPDRIYDGLWEREKLGSTGIGNGIAVPHCKLEGLPSVLLAVGHVTEGIDFGAMDGAPVRLFFVVLSPEAEPAAHLRCLAAISKWIKESGQAEHLLDLHDPEAIYGALTRRPATADSRS